jgi:hypothetical protein
LQTSEHAFEAVELADKNVCLIHLIGHHDELFLRREFEYSFDVFLGKTCASRISRIDDDNRTNISAICLCFVVGTLDCLKISSPILGLIQVIWDTGRVEDRERCSVQRILGDWN